MSGQLRATFLHNAKHFKSNSSHRKVFAWACMQNNKREIRNSSVLIPLCTIEGQHHVLLIKRAAQTNKKSEPVYFKYSYPGGGEEPQDRNCLVETSRRETIEEIPGLSNYNIDIWAEKSLPSLVNVQATYFVNGFVGEILHDFTWREFEQLECNKDEVEKLIAVPIDKCLDPKCFMTWTWDPIPRSMEKWAVKHHTPCYFFKEEKVSMVGWPAYFLNFFLSQTFPDRHDLYFDPKFVWFEHPSYVLHNRIAARKTGHNYKKSITLHS